MPKEHLGSELNAMVGESLLQVLIEEVERATEPYRPTVIAPPHASAIQVSTKPSGY